MAVRNSVSSTANDGKASRSFVRGFIGAACLGAALTAAPLTVAPAFVPQLLPAAYAEQPQRMSKPVLDLAGVLSDSEIKQLEQKIAQVKQDTGLVPTVAFIKTFDGLGAQEWAQQAWEQTGSSDNRVAIAIATEDRNMGVVTGQQVSTDADSISKAAFDALTNDRWFDGAMAAVEQVPGAPTDYTSLAVGGGAAALLGGGAYAFSRSRKRKRTEQEIVQGRSIQPGDINSLEELSTEALETLATEEIVSTDESIRNARTELELARGEFGDHRVSDLAQALSHSERALNSAHQLKQRLDEAKLPEASRRPMLLEIVSSCGTADDQLDAQSARYADMRKELLNATTTLEHFTQRSVDLRTRLPQVRATREGLRQRYSEQMLASISENPELAEAHLVEADQHMEAARGLLAKPAGEQAGLIDELHTADALLAQADKLLRGVETADSDIAAAVAGLDALRAEVRGEIEEAQNLLAAPEAVNFNRTAITTAIEAGKAALVLDESDPLGMWTALTDADAQLDEHLESARDAAQAFAPAMQTLQNALHDAEAQINAAEGLIDTRRRLIGGTARTRLAEAQRHYASAQQISVTPGNDPESNPRRGIMEAQTASKLAREAVRQAQRDIDRHNSNNYRGGGGAGNMVTGMIIGSMLSGGGGFSGGGFSGGGGGGFSGPRSGSSMGF